MYILISWVRFVVRYSVKESWCIKLRVVRYRLFLIIIRTNWSNVSRVIFTTKRVRYLRRVRKVRELSCEIREETHWWQPTQGMRVERLTYTWKGGDTNVKQTFACCLDLWSRIYFFQNGFCECFFVMAGAGTAYRYLFKLWKVQIFLKRCYTIFEFYLS